MICLHEITKVTKFIETESHINGGWLPGAGGGAGREGSYLMGILFQICKMKKFWRAVPQQCEYT